MLERFGSAFRQCLDTVDAVRLLALWKHVYPNLPQPKDLPTARIVMHHARTGAESMRLEARLYSHAWLMERGHKSELPRELRPPVERRESIIVPAVGVCVRTASAFADRKEQAKAVEKVMARAAGDMVRSGITDRARIAPYMWQKRREFLAGTLRREI
ncbi:MAG: hypothetical protein ACTSYE_00675 [Alphaproteobacteria bacterium]